jgi:PAS domain S-box-containing protein
MDQPKEPIIPVEEQFKIMADSAPVLIWISGTDKLCYFFNAGWLRFTGRTLEQEYGNGWVEGVHPDDLNHCLEIYISNFDARKEFKMEYRLKRHDGVYRWLVDSGVPRYAPNGDFAGFIGSCMDIDEMLESERGKQDTINKELLHKQFLNEQLEAKVNARVSELSESEKRFRALVTATSDVIYSLSADWSVMRQLDGRGFLKDTHEPITGWRSRNVHPDDLEKVNAAIDAAIRSKSIFQLEHLVWRADGSPGWTFSRAVPILDDKGEIIEWFGMASDITEQKTNEIRKNGFIGMVSHELKTPLTSLNVILQMLQGKSVKAGDVFMVNAMEQSVKQVKKMTAMINGFLNVSRLESGKINIDKQRFDMAELVKESEAETILMHGLHTFIFHPVERTIVNADKDKIGQVINNLISNAVKYSNAGSTIQVSCLTEGGHAHFSVSDEGIGIDRKHLDQLFNKYYRVENNNHIAGFGIGLYLSAEIIQRHDGKIRVESELGRGSTFYFSLPIS